MSTRPAHTSGPLDRMHLKHGTVAALLLDFEGSAPHRQQLMTRVLDRAATLPTLLLRRPTPGRHRWRPLTRPLQGDAHLRPALPPGPGSDLDASTSTLLHHPLPADPHPPWDLWLLSDPAHRRFRICYRIHHGLQDGVGAAHTVLALLGDQPATGPYPQRAAPPTLRGSLLAGRTFLRALHPPPSWPLLHAPPTRQVHWTCQDVRERPVRDAAETSGVTVNDLCLAALAQALRRWHDTRLASGQPCPDLPVLLPLSLRQANERHVPGNRVTAHPLVLPCSASDLGQAVALVRRQTHAVATTRVRDATRLALQFLPSRLSEYACGLITARRAAPLVTSSVSLPGPMTCLGAPLRAAAMLGDLCHQMFGGLSHQRLGYISFTRAAGVIRCGLLHDRALPDAAVIPHLWQAQLTPP